MPPSSGYETGYFTRAWYTIIDCMFHLPKTLVVRPGALGDALLTLPVLRALRKRDATRVLILGQPSSWAFLRTPSEDVLVADWGSPEWMGLASAEVALGPAALNLLEGTGAGVLYLPGDSSAARLALLKAGLTPLLAIDPPKATPPSRSISKPHDDLTGSSIREDLKGGAAEGGAGGGGATS